MLTVIGSIVIGMLLVGAIFAIRKQVVIGQLKEMLNDHRFESDDRRVRFHIKHHVLQYIYVGGNRHDSFEDALATETFTKKEHETITAIQELMEKERKIINKDLVKPKPYREFTDTPIGDLRIYNSGTVQISPRFVILLGQDKEGNMEVGRAFLAKKDLLADSFRMDFKLVAMDGMAADEVLEHCTGFEEHFLNNTKEYSKEIATYQEISDALDLYNKHKKDFIIERGRLVFSGNVLKAGQPALPQATDPSKQEVDRLILSAMKH